MTQRQRLALLILQLDGEDLTWREAIRLARNSACGDTSTRAATAAAAVRAALNAADAAIVAMGPRRELALA